VLPCEGIEPAKDSRFEPRPSLVVDARMLFSSGIGRYLREILSRRPDWIDQSLYVVCNRAEQCDWFRSYLPAASLIRSKAGIYSLREQWHALTFPKCAAYWVPHYNVPSLSNGRLIVTVHDVAPLALPEAFGGTLKRMATHFYFGRVRSRAQHIITVSQFTKGEILRHGIAASGKISVIPNGVASYWFEGSSVEPRIQRLLYVGNLKPHKNLARLVEAVEKVRLHAAVELTVAGRFDGFRTGLEDSLITQLRSTPWIHLLGETSDEELRKLYNESEALVFPSLYEGFGLPILEAMAAGCPVISSNIPALVELAGASREAGGIVEYFNPEDSGEMATAILRQLRIPSCERTRAAAEGRRLAASHSWLATAKATWELLVDNVLSKAIG